MAEHAERSESLAPSMGAIVHLQGWQGGANWACDVIGQFIVEAGQDGIKVIPLEALAQILYRIRSTANTATPAPTQ